MSPESDARWIEIAGAFAMYDGPASPITQTFRLGLAQPAGGEDLDALERFFRDRGAPVHHEVSPLADAGLPELLNGRGYRPTEFTSVMYRPIDRDIRFTGSRSDAITVRRIESGEEDNWARTAADGWSEFPELMEFMLDVGRVNARRRDAVSFIAELDGRPIATGALSLFEGVALLAGASTIPAARRQGAQLALLEARLRHAADEGCDLAMIGAQPGSASQRNAERHGFRIAYTRIKWSL
jgi:GNAT superfamily N-acetyltransferase